MTLYEKFKNLHIDFSSLGLEQGGSRSDYFCTPKGAKVIGWEGVDGIHYCFVKGFGEVVFAVNPSNLPGDYVHPLARSFEDFLRLLLACKGLAAVEQAHLWDREKFDAFLREDGPPSLERQAALEGLRDGLGLTPMEDSYGYIQEVQASFDYGKIPFRKEYCDCVPEALKRPERPEWRVYFGSGFGGQHRGRDKPGREIPIGKTFSWCGKAWHVLAVYICGKGLVVDICMEVEPEEIWAYAENWRPWIEGKREFTPEEEERQEAENPMVVDYSPRLTVNDRELRHRSGYGLVWAPASGCPEGMEPDLQDRESLRLVERYGLNPERGWSFWRDSFPWATKTKPAVKTLSLFLEADPVSIPGPRFTVSGLGDRVPFTHPATRESHTLLVTEYEAQEIDTSRFPDSGQWEYPAYCTAMSYVVEPEPPRESLTVRDRGQGDRPRRQSDPAGASSTRGVSVTGGVGVIGGADGPVAIMLTGSKRGQSRTACSGLYFEPPKQIEWRMVFRQKPVESIEVDLPLPQNG